MDVPDTPEELACLNEWETWLISMVRQQQTIVKLRPNRGKFATSTLQDAVQGVCAYMPVPINENIYYIHKNLPSTNKVHVIIHQSPTEKNVVWKPYVSLDRVYCALEYLKEHFDDYKDVNVKSREEFSRELDEMLIEQVDNEESDGENESKKKKEGGYR